MSAKKHTCVSKRVVCTRRVGTRPTYLYHNQRIDLKSETGPKKAFRRLFEGFSKDEVKQARGPRSQHPKLLVNYNDHHNRPDHNNHDEQVESMSLHVVSPLLHSQALSTIAGRQVFIKVSLPYHNDNNDHDEDLVLDGDLAWQNVGKDFKLDIDDDDDNMMMTMVTIYCCC